MALGKKTGSSFKYKSRGAEVFKRRSEQSGSTRDSIFRDGVKNFAAADGDNNIRILPPTWADPEHYGYDVYVHYNVGADNGAYLCLQKMKGEACPICEERQRAEKDGDEDYIKSLKPSKRVAIYLLDREKEKEGVQLWSMSWTVDKDICKLAVDKKTGESYEIDNPDEGYDIEFCREGKGLKTKYTGLQIARKSSPLDNDKVLEFVSENPIPELLQYFDYSHIASAFSGSAPKGKKEEDEDEDKPARTPRKAAKDEDGEEDKPSRSSKRSTEDDEEDKKPAPRKSLKKEEPPEEDEEEEKKPAKKASSKKASSPELSYEEVQELEEDDCLEFIEKHDNDDVNSIDPADFDDLKELKAAVCEALDLKAAKKAGGSLKERLAGLKK